MQAMSAASPGVSFSLSAVSDAAANASKGRESSLGSIGSSGAAVMFNKQEAGETETETEDNDDAPPGDSFFGTLDVSVVDNEHQAWRLFQEGKRLFDNGALDAAERKLVKSVQVRTHSQNNGPMSTELASVYVLLSEIATAKGDAAAAKSKLLHHLPVLLCPRPSIPSFLAVVLSLSLSINLPLSRMRPQGSGKRQRRSSKASRKRWPSQEERH